MVSSENGLVLPTSVTAQSTVPASYEIARYVREWIPGHWDYRYSRRYWIPGHWALGNSLETSLGLNRKSGGISH
ncbi:MAG: YXWGXW repeat-containing protein [Rhizonema sp. PD38]|nr:YXWGXW repeat-containing protein [Rhizonema sp. PD38]